MRLTADQLKRAIRRRIIQERAQQVGDGSEEEEAGGDAPVEEERIELPFRAVKDFLTQMGKGGQIRNLLGGKLPEEATVDDYDGPIVLTSDEAMIMGISDEDVSVMRDEPQLAESRRRVRRRIRAAVRREILREASEPTVPSDWQNIYNVIRAGFMSGGVGGEDLDRLAKAATEELEDSARKPEHVEAYVNSQKDVAAGGTLGDLADAIQAAEEEEADVPVVISTWADSNIPESSEAAPPPDNAAEPDPAEDTPAEDTPAALSEVAVRRAVLRDIIRRSRR
jgi:hypothetical protein